MNAADVIAYVGDADVYCEDCAVKRWGGTTGKDSEGNEIGVDFCGAEVDVPQHCGDCGAFLDGYNLTREGRGYTIDAVVEDLAEGKVDSVALTEWAPAFDIPTDLGPDFYADRFDIVSGAYWACRDYNGGGESPEYRHLCKLGRYYRPGANESSATIEGDALGAYVRVAVGIMRRSIAKKVRT